MNDKRFHEVFGPWMLPLAILFYLISYLTLKAGFHLWWIFLFLATPPALLIMAYLDGYEGEQVYRERQILEEMARQERQARRKR